MSRTTRRRVQVVPGWAIQARRHKELWCRRHPASPDAPALLATIEAGRTTAVFAIPPTGTPDVLLCVANAVQGFGPGAVTLCNDSYTLCADLTTPEGAEAARRHQAGGPSLQELFAAGHPLVVETMLATRVDRRGHVACWSFPYRVDAGVVSWLDDRAEELPADIEGRIPEMLVTIMAKIPGLAATPEFGSAALAHGVRRSQMRLIAARAAICWLEARGCVVLYLDDEFA